MPPLAPDIASRLTNIVIGGSSSPARPELFMNDVKQLCSWAEDVADEACTQGVTTDIEVDDPALAADRSGWQLVESSLRSRTIGCYLTIAGRLAMYDTSVAFKSVGGIKRAETYMMFHSKNTPESEHGLFFVDNLSSYPFPYILSKLVTVRSSPAKSEIGAIRFGLAEFAVRHGL